MMKDTERIESMPDCQEHFYNFHYPAGLIVLFWFIILLAVWQIFGWIVIVSIGKAALYILAGIAIVIFLLDFLSQASSTAKKDIDVLIFLQRPKKQK